MFCVTMRVQSVREKRDQAVDLAWYYRDLAESHQLEKRILKRFGKESFKNM